MWDEGRTNQSLVVHLWNAFTMEASFLCGPRVAAVNEEFATCGSGSFPFDPQAPLFVPKGTASILA
jgi:hypothetical protein